MNYMCATIHNIKHQKREAAESKEVATGCVQPDVTQLQVMATGSSIFVNGAMQSGTAG